MGTDKDGKQDACESILEGIGVAIHSKAGSDALRARDNQLRGSEFVFSLSGAQERVGSRREPQVVLASERDTPYLLGGLGELTADPR
ncbi:hypothetical protein PQX77_002085, partial [Marasmius sp. AFHP31]